MTKKWYKIYSGEETYNLTEEEAFELVNKMAEKEKLIENKEIIPSNINMFTFQNENEDWVAINSSYIKSIAPDEKKNEEEKEKELKEKNEKERIERAKKVQEAAKEEQEPDIIEKFIK